MIESCKFFNVYLTSQKACERQPVRGIYTYGTFLRNVLGERPSCDDLCHVHFSMNDNTFLTESEEDRKKRLFNRTRDRSNVKNSESLEHQFQALEIPLEQLEELARDINSWEKDGNQATVTAAKQEEYVRKISTARNLLHDRWRKLKVASKHGWDTVQELESVEDGGDDKNLNTALKNMRDRNALRGKVSKFQGGTGRRSSRYNPYWKSQSFESFPPYPYVNQPSFQPQFSYPTYPNFGAPTNFQPQTPINFTYPTSTATAPPSSGQGSSRKQIVCFKCGVIGHKAPDCNVNPSQSQPPK